MPITEKTNLPSPSTEAQEIRLLIATILRSWKMLLIFAALFGLLAGAISYIDKPSYFANAIVVIDPSLAASVANPINYLKGETIVADVAKSITPTSAELSSFTITADKADKSVFILTVTSDDPDRAKTIVNEWADTSVTWVTHTIDSESFTVKGAESRVVHATSALLAYLAENGLSTLTWSDLSSITGIGSNSATILVNQQSLINLTITQREEISILMQEVVIAEDYYRQVSLLHQRDVEQLQSRAFILTKASSAVESSRIRSVVAIPLGILCGLNFAVILLLISNWWHTANPASKQPSLSG